jgi:hypothetical protein
MSNSKCKMVWFLIRCAMISITLVLLNGCSQLFSIRLDGNIGELYFVFLKKDGKHASKFKIIDIAVKKIPPDSDPYSQEGEFV